MIKRGRPAQGIEGTPVRVTIVVGKDTHEYLKLLGKGNTSHGVRIAAALAKGPKHG